jgi:hypothetical protein
MSLKTRNGFEKKIATKALEAKMLEENFAIVPLKTYMKELKEGVDLKIIDFSTLNKELSNINKPIKIKGVLRKQRIFNAGGFAASIHQQLSEIPNLSYTLEIKKAEKQVYTFYWNWARRPQDSYEKGWRPYVDMHIASVSKLITAMACIRLLRERNISVNTPIVHFLPEYFRIGNNIGKITIADLLTHKSGFLRVESGGINDGYSYTHFKDWIQRGVVSTNYGQSHYHNGNFIALRVIIAVILDSPKRSFAKNIDLFWSQVKSEAERDYLWDSQSIYSYIQEVKTQIFTPAQVQGLVLGNENSSLAYNNEFKTLGSYINAYNYLGTVGWWLSCEQLTRIMNTFLNTNRILPSFAARSSFVNGFGIDDILYDGQNYPDCFAKSGYWSDGDGRTQQTFVAFAPQKHSIAITVNTPIPNSTVNDIGLNTLRRYLS